MRMVDEATFLDRCRLQNPTRLCQLASQKGLRIAQLDPHDVDKIGHENPDAVQSLPVEFYPE
jgi:hypothetical protein